MNLLHKNTPFILQYWGAHLNTNVDVYPDYFDIQYCRRRCSSDVLDIYRRFQLVVIAHGCAQS